ncbi:hypothetical protein Emed_006671 [Eimeria media]
MGHRFNRDVHVSAAVQWPKKNEGGATYSAGAAQDSKRTMQPSPLPPAEAGGQKQVSLPESTEAVQPPPSPSVVLDREAAMRELAAAAESTAAAEKSLSSNQPVSPEARESLTALRYLSLPQLDTQALEVPCKIIFAEISTPIERQVQVKRVAASMTRFVGETDRVAIFEVHVSDPLFASLFQGPHHLRLGYSPVERDQAFYNPTAVLNAALKGGKPTKAILRVLEKCMQLGYANAVEASRLTALLLPIYVAKIPRFEQKFAWVGGKVYFPTATLSPAFVCSLADLLLLPSTAPSVSPAENLTSTAPTQLPGLSVAAREYAAFRILTAVCKLHSLGTVHGDLTLRSIVVTRDGDVLLSALESARFVPLNASSKSSLSAATDTPTDLQADRTNTNNAEEPLTASEVAAPAGGVPVAVQPTLSSNDSSAGGLLDPQQELAQESVQLGMLLLQVLSGGTLPSALTETGNAAESIQASQQGGLFPPSEVVSSAAMELQRLGVSPRWQACVHALINSQQRQTALQAAATFIPEAVSPGDTSSPDTEARG